MAGLGSVVSGFSKLLWRTPEIMKMAVRMESNTSVPAKSGMNPDKWLDWKMVRDVKRRRCVKEHATMRVRLMSMKRNNILPPEIRELACQAMDEIPRQSSLGQVAWRCVLTSRPRGVVYRWRLSRIVFRDLADHNQLSGVQRAMW